MISGFWLIVVLSLALKTTATPEVSPTTLQQNQRQHHQQQQDSSAAGRGAAAGGRFAGWASSQPSPPQAPTSSSASASSAKATSSSSSSPLATTAPTSAAEAEAEAEAGSATAAIESEAHDLKKEGKKLGAAGSRVVVAAKAKVEAKAKPKAKRKASEFGEVIASEQVNVSSSKQSEERGGQPGLSSLQPAQPLAAAAATAAATTLEAAAAAEGGGGGGADEKVLQPSAADHDYRHHETTTASTATTSTTSEQVASVGGAAAAAAASSNANANSISNLRKEESSPSQQREERVPLAATTRSQQQQQPPTRQQGKGPVVYTNQFVIEVEGGEEEAKKLAQKHGFVYLNHILADFYHLEHRRLSKRSLSADQDLADISIRDEPQVLLLERQVLKRRVKRDFIEIEPPPSEHQAAAVAARLGRAHSQIRPPNQPRPPPAQQQVLRPSLLAGGGRQHAPQQHQQHHHTQPPTRPANQSPAPPQSRLSQQLQRTHFDSTQPDNLLDSLEVSASTPSSSFNRQQQQSLLSPNSRIYYQPQQQQQNNQTLATSATTQIPIITSVISSGNKTTIGGDNYFSNSSSSSNETSKRPFNDPSWPLMWYLDGGAKNGFDLNVMAAWKMGYTGRGIVITILDDGLEKDHPDLQANYDPLASFDINGDDADPMPRYDINDSNRHGTRCAGEVAAVSDNNICSVGIAYNSKVGGVRMLDGDVTDAVEARSLSLNNQHIHIYSASWGPDDNGKTVDGPGVMATRAFIDGVTNGRHGLGSIFVFASGNGGREHDNCNCDGYTNSIWTLSISSATENGYVPWYIEACSSTLATTYSSGSYEERQIATTDLHHSCTSSHTGTSASAPLAAGICALVLESNPRLTWRDMQHIVVRTAKPANLVAKDWRTNALGRNVSHAFGYGLMDAGAMILMAKQWTTVPTQYTCAISLPQMERPILGRNKTEVKLSAQCANVSYLEHVQSKVSLSAPRRGDLHIYLVSPGGTRSTLLAKRPNDHAEQGFSNWPFMTVHNWGESPNGIWTLEVRNDGSLQTRAYLKEWTLILYGTKEDPNKHLDSIAPATEHPKQQPSHHQHRPAQSPAGHGSGPPPPISLEPQQPTAEITVQQPIPATTPAVNTATSTSSHQQHWSTYSPPSSSSLPPPLPPLAPVRVPTTVQPGGSSTSTTSSSSTTQASYVTTFNTIVSSSARPQQPHKADFDIVSPASEQPPPPPPPTTTAANDNEPSTEEPKQNVKLPGEELNIRKPPVELMTDNHLSFQQSSGRPPAGSVPPNNLDLAGNQIDLKLTKDYRSSGNQQHEQKAAESEQQTKQKSSSASGSSAHLSKDNVCILLASFIISAALMLRQHQQLDQLVRHSINVI